MLSTAASSDTSQGTVRNRGKAKAKEKEVREVIEQRSTRTAKARPAVRAAMAAREDTARTSVTTSPSRGSCRTRNATVTNAVEKAA